MAAEQTSDQTANATEEMLRQETGDVELVKPYGIIFASLALLWSLYQLWIASPLPFALNFGVLGGVPARALHLSFALALCFLAFGVVGHTGERRPHFIDICFAIVGVFCTSYLWWNYDGLAERAGILLEHNIFGMQVPTEVILGGIGLLLLLEATRRAIGLPLVIMGLLFLLYSVFGQSMPDLIAHKGVSISRLVGYQWLTGEAIFGIPIDVSTRFVFLFVLFGAILDRAGAGQYFIDLAFGLVGKYRGGPAKAAVLASGMTGMISGSSIANTVTTGTFTIPVMKKTGLPGTKAGAFEVAASVNGQIMPPIMGAAAFVIAEFIGITYFDVVTHAFIPAVISYIALFYITDLEAQKLRLVPMKAEEVTPARKIFWRGAHYIVPIVLLVYLLMVERMTAGTAVFWATVLLMAIVVVQEIVKAQRAQTSLFNGLKHGCILVIDGLIMGAKNMIGVAIAVAAAGIIVGAVASTGLSNALSGVVEALAGGNVYMLLILVALLSIVLGMGLPTTANYLVVASLMAPVIVEVGGASGLILPLIAVHLFVFYFGLMADVTPPVGLASYAAAAISRADPIKTGVQAFIYSIRTAILPFIFIFNLDLLLVDVSNPLNVVKVFVVSLIAILAFTALTFRWMFVKLNWVEMALLALVTVGLFRPDFVMNRFSPPYSELTTQNLAKGVQEKQIRLHILRNTDYGERRRLYVFDQKKGQSVSWKALGITPGAEKDGHIEVQDVKFLGTAEKRGIRAGDFITTADAKVENRPAKEWIFIPSFILLLIVVMWQLRRKREQQGNNEAPVAA